ncbi:hypothetical protein HIMB11_02379 [Rhodobacteraceae bacterium HIMB11]|nr:hypothetical protein HIMB11_02379 [Rhodobacteraceae bacterium HIMB11]
MILITPEETSSPLNEDIERLQTNLRGQDIGKTDQSGPSGKCGHVWVCHAVVGDYTVRAKILP